MSENQKKILVALDGSERSLKTIEYLCEFKAFSGRGIVLFNVFSGVPECYWDMGKDPFSRNAMSQAKGWEFHRKKEMEAFMERSKRMLVLAGYSDVTVCIQNRKQGVARDIIAEASKNYFALLIRRRGYSGLLHMVMGSTTAKLVEKLSSVPVLLAGVEKAGGSILVSVDGSSGSERALDFTIQAIGDSDCRIVVCSVLRDCDLQGVSVDSDGCADWMNAFVTDTHTAVDDAVKKLEKAGIPSHKIGKRIITGAKTRAGAIAQAAEEETCDTIVLGRRGKSQVSDFDIGRVPWKVIHTAKKKTVWIVD